MYSVFRSNKRVVKGKRPKYIPWFNDDFGADFTFEDVVEALTLYKDVYGSFDSIEEDELIIPEPVEERLPISPFELAALNDDADQPSDLDDIDGINAPWNEDEAGIDAEGADFSVVAVSIVPTMSALPSYAREHEHPSMHGTMIDCPTHA